MPSILAVGYLVAVRAHYNPAALWPAFLFLLASLAVGAAYVSMLNDCCDIKDDAAAGKPNRMASLSAAKRAALLAVAIVLGVCCCCIYIRQYVPTALLYIAPWVAFTLYSAPPFRFKKHPLAGVLADACGAHLFPSLTVLSFVSVKTGQSIPILLWIAVGAWALMLGLRGILGHQACDGKNDLHIGFRSFVHVQHFHERGAATLLIAVTEFAALAIMLAVAGSWIPALLVPLYLAYSYALYKKWGTVMVFIHPPPAGGYRIFMNNYYQVFLPVGLLTAAALQHQQALLVAAGHLLLFWAGVYAVSVEAGTLAVVNAVALAANCAKKTKAP